MATHYLLKEPASAANRISSSGDEASFNGKASCERGTINFAKRCEITFSNSLRFVVAQSPHHLESTVRNSLTASFNKSLCFPVSRSPGETRCAYSFLILPNFSSTVVKHSSINPNRYSIRVLASKFPSGLFGPSNSSGSFGFRRCGLSRWLSMCFWISSIMDTITITATRSLPFLVSSKNLFNCSGFIAASLSGDIQ
jgi:hypothetical protein